MFKTILVHLKGTSGDKSSLAAAYALTRPFTPHLEALHIRPDIETLMARASMSGSEGDTIALADMVDAMQEQAARLAQQASDTYDSFCRDEQIVRAEFPPGPGGPNAAFRESLGVEVEELMGQGRYYDLVVVKGGGESSGGLSTGDLGRLVTTTGKPILLAPDAPAKPAQTIVVAWKDTPEAARAVTAAMPLLEKAQTVYLVGAEEDGRASNYEGVEAQLKWHGLNAQVQRVNPGDREPAHATLEAARALGADLLVMGGYGRSRLSETLLGGFTRAVLQDASLPVFLFH